MDTQAVTFTVSNLIATVVVLGAALVALIVWVYQTQISELKQKITKLEGHNEEIKKLLVQQNEKLELITKEILDELERSEETTRELEKQFLVFRERTSMSLKFREA